MLLVESSYNIICDFQYQILLRNKIHITIWTVEDNTCRLSSDIIFDLIHLHYMFIEFIYYKLMKIMNIVFVFVKLVQLYLQL